MSVLICMASYCTDENDRLKYAVRTVENIFHSGAKDSIPPTKPP